MFCRFCGAENPDNSAFCRQCGKRIELPNRSTGLAAPEDEDDTRASEAPTETPAPAEPGIGSAGEQRDETVEDPRHMPAAGMPAAQGTGVAEGSESGASTQPVQGSPKRDRVPKAAVVAVIVVALLAIGGVVGYLLWNAEQERQAEAQRLAQEQWNRDHRTYTSLVSLAIPDYDESNSSPVPFLVEGTDFEGNSYREYFALTPTNNSIELMRGNYTIKPVCSPVNNGTIYRYAAESQSIVVDETGAHNARNPPSATQANATASSSTERTGEEGQGESALATAENQSSSSTTGEEGSSSTESASSASSSAVEEKSSSTQASGSSSASDKGSSSAQESSSGGESASGPSSAASQSDRSGSAQTGEAADSAISVEVVIEVNFEPIPAEEVTDEQIEQVRNGLVDIGVDTTKVESYCNAVAQQRQTRLDQIEAERKEAERRAAEEAARRANPASVDGSSGPVTVKGTLVREEWPTARTLMAWSTVAYFLEFDAPVQITYRAPTGKMTETVTRVQVESIEQYDKKANIGLDSITSPTWQPYVGRYIAVRGDYLVNTGNAHTLAIQVANANLAEAM